MIFLLLGFPGSTVLNSMVLFSFGFPGSTVLNPLFGFPGSTVLSVFIELVYFITLLN